MSKRMRFITRFADHLFGFYNVPKIPIIIERKSKIVENSDGFGDGLLVRDNDGPKILLAGKYKTRDVMKVLSREFFHYLQYLHKRDIYGSKTEEERSFFSSGAFWAWIFKKKYGFHIYDTTTSFAKNKFEQRN